MAKPYIKLRAMTTKKKSGGRPGLFFALVILVGLAGLLWWINQGRQSKAEKVVAKPPSNNPAPTTPIPTLPRPVIASNKPVVIRTNPPPVAASRANAPVAPPPAAVVTTANGLGIIVRSPGSIPVPPSVTTNAAVANTGFPRPVQNPFEAQLAMARLGISSGSLDGALGSQTRAALIAFQAREDLPATGTLDDATKARLLLPAPPCTTYTVSETDLARIHPVPTTWIGKSQETVLDYETILELVSETSWSHPNLIKRLNPGINWSNVVSGTVVQVPNVERPSASRRAAVIHIHLAGKTLEAFDAEDHLIAHFPCSIAARVEKRPVGGLQVVNFAQNPDYTFDPAVFPESAEARTITRKLRIPPGPNNPVGVAWITLDKPGYGIHGTPRPEDVGRTESHGCFRLANWNADYLLRLVTAGTPVVVEP